MAAFQLHDYQERPLPVALNAVGSDYAVMRRMLGGGEVSDVRIQSGQLIPGTNYILDAIQPPVRLPEKPMAQFRVRIKNSQTGARHLLNKEKTIGLKDRTAVLVSPQSRFRFVAKPGDLFTTVSSTLIERRYEVLSLSKSEVSVRDLDGNGVFVIR